MDKLEIPVNTDMEGASSLAVILCDTQVTHEAGEDFTLPDYIPGVRRIISVWTRVLPENGFLSGEVLEFGGTIVFGVTYTDEDGGVRFVPLTSEYSADAKISGDCAADRISIDTRADTPTLRVLGPRRLSLKTKLRTRLLSFGTSPSGEQLTDTEGNAVSSAEELSVERLEAKCPTLTRGISRLTGEASGEWRMRSASKPQCCDGVVVITDLTQADGSIRIVGELAMKCMCEGEDGTYSACRIRIPFEETMAADGIIQDSRIRASGRCASVALTAEEDESGLYNCAVEYDIDCEWLTESECTLTEDLYSSRCPVKLTSSECECAVPLKCAVGQVSVSGASPYKLAENEYLADIDAAASAGKCERQADGRIVVSGEMMVRPVLAGGDEKRGEEFAVPFRYEVMPDMTGASCESGADAGMVWRCDVTVTDINGRIDSGGLQVNAELGISLCAVSKRRVKFVSEAQLDKDAPYSREGAEICVYYSSNGDKLWDVGKRYHVSRAALVGVNKMTGDSLPPAVIIP